MEGKEFSRLRIPVHTVEKGQDIVHKFKELEHFPEFSLYPHADRNNVIRYVVYAYDPESPFVKNSTLDLIKRRETAAEHAGFERNKKTGKFTDSTYQIINMEVEAVNNMIFCYLKVIHNYTWVQITTDEQLFWEYTKLLNQPLVNDDEKKLMESANIKGKLRIERNLIKQDLDKYYKELYGDNADFQEKIERVTPETIYKHFTKVS
jgi:hypothetical protein